MNEHHILTFMIQVAVVLAAARILGELFRRWKQPPLAGEILAGILLGQTVLGQISPDAYITLFPPDDLQHAMFGVVAEIGILFLLLVVGLEVNLKSAWKMRNQTFGVAVTGVVVPLALGTAAAWLLYDQWVETDTPRFAFALLVGAGVAITAITVVARLLFDLRIIKSDLGLFLVSAMALNELLGWVVLAVVLGMVGAGAEGGSGMGLVATMAGILLFAGFATTVGRVLTTRTLQWMDRAGLPSPAAPLSFVVCIGLIGGIITGALGVHPVFGFLLAGMMAGDPKAFSEHTRSIIGQMVESIFVPLFFAGICLHVDFASQFDLVTVLLVTALSVGGKFFGAWLGTLFVRMPIIDRVPVAIAHIPGGPMGVLLASVALEAGVIGPKMFVALVIASIVSALLVGPGFAWQLQRRRARNIMRWFSRDMFEMKLSADSPQQAIEVLSKYAARKHGAPDAPHIADAVNAREADMGTGMGDDIAIPHARLASLEAPVVVFGRCKDGIDWDAVDGKPTHLVFMVLTPADDPGVQLEILGAIAKSLRDPADRRLLIEAQAAGTAWQHLARCLSRSEPSDGN